MLHGLFCKKYMLPAVAAFALLVLSLFLINSIIPLLTMRDRIDSYRIGETAVRDVIAPYSFLYVDEAATNSIRRSAERAVPPVYSRNAGTTDANRRLRDEFCQTLLQLLAEERYAQARDLLAVAEFDWESVPDADLEPVVLEFGIILNEAIEDGAVAALFRSNPSGEIEIVSITDGSSSIHSAEDTLILADPYVYVDKSGSHADAAAALFSLIQPDLLLDVELMEIRRNDETGELMPVQRQIRRGDRLIAAGERVNIGNLQLLEHIYRRNGRIVLFNLMQIALLLLLLTLFSVSAGCFIYRIGGISRHDFYLTVSSCSVLIILGSFVAQTANIPAIDSRLLIPFVFFAMIPALLLESKLALLAIHAVSLYFLIYLNDITAPLLFLMQGTLSVILCNKAVRRITLIRAGFIVGLASALFLAFFGILTGQPFSAELLPNLLLTFLNPLLCALLAIGILPVFDSLLGFCSNFRLMELADSNNLILKRMATLAPGTYMHSIMVANLAEQACRNIGADPLLARTGALYHDIGKMEQAHYFIENQTDENRHDMMKTALSVTVIKSHVKLGVEKAHENKLPKQVIDIIEQHHGSEVIRYFYEQELATNPDAEPGDFSYSGPNPATREAAVVFFADLVEAAGRTLNNPTLSRLRPIVDELVAERVRGGALESCPMTYADLEAMKRSFAETLTAQSHQRISYDPQEIKEKKNEQSRV